MLNLFVEIKPFFPLFVVVQLRLYHFLKMVTIWPLQLTMLVSNCGIWENSKTSKLWTWKKVMRYAIYASITLEPIWPWQDLMSGYICVNNGKIWKFLMTIQLWLLEFDLEPMLPTWLQLLWIVHWNFTECKCFHGIFERIKKSWILFLYKCIIIDENTFKWK